MGVSLAVGGVIASRYRLDRVLGHGGMGAVWAATHLITRRSVAMKFLRGPAHARAGLRQRLLREARAASAVNHPNVVEVHDLFELDDETPVMVMDLLIGETLGQRIAREETLSLEETATLIAPVVSAVGTAHARGVVHRDLKPENIFLVAGEDGSTVVKVLDFGVAKILAPDGQPLESGPVTETGAVVGTPCYMAPEQALGEKDIDHRADIWALGAILYECLSGGRPIEGESVGQIVMHLMSCGITPLARATVDLPEEITDLVDRMLARHKNRRPPDLREVQGVLARHTSAVTPPFGAPGSEASPRATIESDLAPAGAATSRASSSWRRPLAMGALAIAAGLGAVWVRTPGNEPDATASPSLASSTPAPVAEAEEPEPIAATGSPPAPPADSVSSAIAPASSQPQKAGTTTRIPMPPRSRDLQAPQASLAATAPSATSSHPPPAASMQKAESTPAGLAEKPPY